MKQRPNRANEAPYRQVSDIAAPAVVVALESPNQHDVHNLLRNSHEYYAALYPRESNYVLGPEALMSPAVDFLVARRSGVLVGVGALIPHEPGVGEIKSMFVVEAERGKGIGGRILGTIELRALNRGIASLRLETGRKQPEALALYTASGYRRIGPFGRYRSNDFSIFMEKTLADRDTTGAHLGERE